MAEQMQPSAATALEPPRLYLIHMLVFTLACAILSVVLLPDLIRAFAANAGLNLVIVATLFLGMFHSYRMVWRLFPEVTWVNHFREAPDGQESARMPRLLGPMATLLRNRQSALISSQSMRSMLDSLSARLDEARDLSRYLVGLLIFLGLLGTFWGLLTTVTSIGDAINALDVSSTQSGTVFEGLKEGLKGPLGGMGLSFSSSMFGLAGSLVLGFLDLKAAQAQNRFYNDLEDWLSTITDIAGETGGQAPAQPMLRLDLQGLQRSVDRLASLVEMQRNVSPSAPSRPTDPASMESLADAVASLVGQMREEQKMVRQWAQSQQVQQNEIQRLLIRASGPSQQRPTKARVDEE